jgi:hypothetical protein
MLDIRGKPIDNAFSVGLQCERGSGLKSDYAIDDVILTKGLCKGTPFTAIRFFYWSIYILNLNINN